VTPGEEGRKHLVFYQEPVSRASAAMTGMGQPQEWAIGESDRRGTNGGNWGKPVPQREDDVASSWATPPVVTAGRVVP
jgi:hypothetical protein